MMTEALGNGLIAGTVIACVAWGANALLRKAPALLRNWAWRGALLAFWLMPVVVLIAARVGSRYAYTVSVPEVPVPPALRGPVLDSASTPAPAAAPGLGRTEMPEAPPATRQPRLPHVSLLGVCLLLWLAGVLWYLAQLCRQEAQVRRLVRGAAPAGPGLNSQVGVLAGQLGLWAPPPVRLTEAARAPMVCGLRKPVLLFPAIPWEGTEGSEAVVVHELAHVRRGDVWVQAAAAALKALLWWHPLVWLTSTGLRTTAEEACDDWVVALTGRRRGYAEELLAWAEAGATGALGCAQRGRPLVQRVKRILDDRRQVRVQLPPWARLAMVLGLAVLFVGVGLGRVRPAAHAQPPPAKPAGPQPRLEFFIGREISATEEGSPGARVFKYKDQPGWRYVWQGKPFLTGDSIIQMSVGAPTQAFTYHTDDRVAEIFVLFDAAGTEVLKDVTAVSAGKSIVVTLDGEVVAAPAIQSGRASGQVVIPLETVTEAQRHKLLQMAGWGQTPRELPGTGRIKLTARFADGSKPVSPSCEIRSTALMEQQRNSPELVAAEAKRPRPKAVGKDGDWVIYNVTPGEWWIEVNGDDCARCEFTVSFGASGGELPINISLGRGGTVSGRVLRDDTGRPLGNAAVACASLRANSDKEGRFTLPHVGSGTRIVWTQEGRLTVTPLEPARTRVVVMDARASDLIPFIGGDFDLADGQSVTLPDIRLLRGGWVVGHVVRPEDAPAGKRLYWSISPIPQGPDPKGWWRHREFSDEFGPQGRFRFLLPAGKYALDVTESVPKGRAGPPRWAGGLRGITVRAGETTPEIAVQVKRVSRP